MLPLFCEKNYCKILIFVQKIKCAKNYRKFEKNAENTKKDIRIQTMFPYPDQEEFVESVERAAEYQSAPVQQLS